MAVAQQGEEIAALLRTLDEAQSGFMMLRASVDAVSRHGSAGAAKTETLRKAALRLPAHAESLASILRGIPDFAPRYDF